MTNLRTRLGALTLAGTLLAGFLVAGAALPAQATNGGEDCAPREGKPAWTEVVPDINHPAEYETVVVTPGQEAKPAVWANFSPNKDQGPFVGPPTYPTDPRGTWHDKGHLPPGQAGPDGVYEQRDDKGEDKENGKGGDWFYRQAAVPAVEEVTEERLVKEAWIEVVPDIEHPEVLPITCEEDPEDPVFSECVSTGSTHFTNLSAWNLSETRAAGHNVLVENGLHVYTDDASSLAKAAGYLAVDFALKDYGSFDLDWTGTSPAPGGQMLVDLDNDGTPTGYLVIEDAYNGEWWLSANWNGDVPASELPVSAVGGGGADWASPQEFLNAFPDARIKAIGYSLGSGVKGDGVISSITAGCHVYTFGIVPPVTYEPSCTTVNDSFVIEGDGKISVPGGWESESIDVPLNGISTLADIGTVLNIEADPLQYVGLHIDTAEGTIVFEEEDSYQGKLWSETAWEGVEAGMGYAAFGSITDYIELNGDVAVTGIRLLYTHPEASTTTVESFTIGCTVYTFEPAVVVVPEKPADIVTVDTREAKDCITGTVTTYVVTTTTGSVYNAETNTWDRTEPVITRTSSERPVETGECPVVTPPAEEPPVTEPPAKEEPPVTPAFFGPLALTGGEFGWIVLAIVIALLLVIGGTYLYRRQRA